MPRISVDNIKPEKTATTTPTPPPVPQTLPNNVDSALMEKSGGKLSAFSAFPDGISFQGEGEGETIILLLRKHIITNVPWILVTIILLLFPIFIFPLLFLTNIIPPLPLGFKFVGTFFWYLGTVTYVIINFLYWYFNVYIVTKERVIDVDWYSLLYRRVTAAPMSKVQDVSNTIGGVIRSVFDFGNVHIETAGELENIEFEDIPHPALVAQKIEELIQIEEKQWEANP